MFNRPDSDASLPVQRVHKHPFFRMHLFLEQSSEIKHLFIDLGHRPQVKTASRGKKSQFQIQIFYHLWSKFGQNGLKCGCRVHLQSKATYALIFLIAFKYFYLNIYFIIIISHRINNELHYMS